MSDQNLTLRIARISDLETLTNLLVELFKIEVDFTPDAARQRSGLKLLLQDPRAAILVAENSGRVIGMCTVQMLISTAEGGQSGLLEDMIVDRRFRRQGIGQALLRAAEKWAEVQGLLRLQLLTESDNSAALAFYSKMGWQDTGLVCRRKKFFKSLSERD